MERFEYLASQSTAREIRTLAREYGLTESEVLDQLVDLGLEELDDGQRVEL
ncbi:MAG: CopG family transcriptional regulator [Halobacteriales archaeon]|nr:CopG family transcriptional regulator [Halobacteriales archaeon]